MTCTSLRLVKPPAYCVDAFNFTTIHNHLNNPKSANRRTTSRLLVAAHPVTRPSQQRCLCCCQQFVAAGPELRILQFKVSPPKSAPADTASRNSTIAPLPGIITALHSIAAPWRNLPRPNRQRRRAVSGPGRRGPRFCSASGSAGGGSSCYVGKRHHGYLAAAVLPRGWGHARTVPVPCMHACMLQRSMHRGHTFSLGLAVAPLLQGAASLLHAAHGNMLSHSPLAAAATACFEQTNLFSSPWPGQTRPGQAGLPDRVPPPNP